MHASLMSSKTAEQSRRLPPAALTVGSVTAKVAVEKVLPALLPIWRFSVRLARMAWMSSVAKASPSAVASLPFCKCAGGTLRSVATF